MTIIQNSLSAAPEPELNAAASGTSPRVPGTGAKAGTRANTGSDARAGQRRSAAEHGTNVVELYPGATQRMKRRPRRRLSGSEAGMATAEYAITTLAAVGFAGLLVFILRSDEVRGFLLNLIRTALTLP